MIDNEFLSFREPRILRVHVEIPAEAPPEPLTVWTVAVDREPDNETHQIIIGNLVHANGQLEARITIGARLAWAGPTGPRDSAEFLEAIASSQALETLYDVARISLTGPTSLLERDYEIPYTSPVASMSFIGESTPSQSDDE